MKPLRPNAAAFFILLCTLTATAQIGIYAGFSGAHLSSGSSTTTIYGPLIGAYAQKGSFLKLGADARGSFLSHNGQQFNTGAIGPRIAFHPMVLPFKPYVEALVGIASSDTGTSSSSTHLNYQILGGIDTTLLPRLDWRVIEFDYSALAGSSLKARILTTGIVLRLP